MSLEEQERFIAFTATDLREVIRSGQLRQLMENLNEEDLHSLDDAIAEVWNTKFQQYANS